MTSPAITSVFNDAYIAEAFESYRRDPASVDESWRQYFRTMEALAGLSGGAPAAGGGDAELPRKAAAAASLVHGIREHGHLAVRIDPLGSEPLGARELTPEYYGITEADLDAVPASKPSDSGRRPTSCACCARATRATSGSSTRTCRPTRSASGSARCCAPRR
jgi:2-oxoglutarate dehydrogenase E1 component